MSKTLTQSDALRKAAEVQLAQTSLTQVLPRPAEELLHELQVHQIELEMQNEELRQAQHALEMSRDRFVDLYEFAPLAYFTINRDGVIAEANLTGASLLGIERSKLLKHRFTNYVNPKDVERWNHYFKSMLQNNMRQKFELMLLHSNGSNICAMLDSVRINTDNAAALRIALIDITERKQAEEQARKSNENFHLMVESVSDCGIVMLDTRGYIVSWNSGAQRLTGYSEEEIIGQHFSRFYPREDIESGKPQRELDATIARRRLEDEGLRVRKDGSTFWARVVFTSIRGQDGNLLGFSKLTRDITELKRTENNLLENKQRLESILSAIPDLLFEVGLDGYIYDYHSPRTDLLATPQRYF